MSFQAWRKPSKISGVNFPPRCPHDFETQVRGLVRKHNDLIDDLATYQATVRELQMMNAELKTQLETSQKTQTQLKAEYDQLKDLSEKVASRYERQQVAGAHRVTPAAVAVRPAAKRPTAPARLGPPQRPVSHSEPEAAPKSPAQPSPPPSSPIDSPKPESAEVSDDEEVLEVEA